MAQEFGDETSHVVGRSKSRSWKKWRKKISAAL